jgi:hypothetical protein
VADQQSQETQTIPFAVGSNFKPEPVRANFPDQSQPEMKLIRVEPDQTPPKIEPTKGIFDTQPFSGTTHLVFNMPSGTIVLIIVVIAIAAMVISFLRWRK